MRYLTDELREVSVRDPAADPVDAGWAAHLATSRRLRIAANSLVAEDVRVARSYGASWAEIGLVLGISEQAAQEHYHDHA